MGDNAFKLGLQSENQVLWSIKLPGLGKMRKCQSSANQQCYDPLAGDWIEAEKLLAESPLNNECRALVPWYLNANVEHFVSEHEPVGVNAAKTPWSAPEMIAYWKIAPMPAALPGLQ